MASIALMHFSSFSKRNIFDCRVFIVYLHTVITELPVQRYDIFLDQKRAFFSSGKNRDEIVRFVGTTFLFDIGMLAYRIFNAL